jgi:hypothetical protein
MIDFSKLPRRYVVRFYGDTSGNTSFHTTKENALKAAYDWLDLAQRDALAMGEQAKADAIGRERHTMASSWANILKLRGWVCLFTGSYVTIRTETKGRHY